jgi:thioredoxin reductase (NADPH)
VVTEIKNEDKLENIAIKNNKTGEQQDVPSAGLFIYIGVEPKNTDWLYRLVKRDNHGFILTGSDVANNGHPQGWMTGGYPFLLETNVPDIFAAVYVVMVGILRELLQGGGRRIYFYSSNTSIFKKSVNNFISLQYYKNK